jgi:opacity protein-like surface antigen
MIVLAMTVAATGLAPATAHAQRYFGALASYSYDGAAGECPSLWDDCPNRRTGYGVVFGGIGGGFGFEQEIAWTPDFFGEGADFKSSNVLTVMSNVVFSLPAGPLRPYGSAGLGFIKAKAEFTSESLTDFSDTALGWNYGAGVMVMLPAHLGVRLDYRRFRSGPEVSFLGGDEKVEFSRVSVGLILH